MLAPNNYNNKKIEEEVFKHAQERLLYIINISEKAPKDFESFWNRTIDHRIIGLVAITSYFNEIYPSKNFLNYHKKYGVSFFDLRRLCRCTDRTMYNIIRQGVDRGEIIKSKLGRNIYIKGTKKLMQAYVDFEKRFTIKS